MASLSKSLRWYIQVWLLANPDPTDYSSDNRKSKGSLYRPSAASKLNNRNNLSHRAKETRPKIIQARYRGVRLFPRTDFPSTCSRDLITSLADEEIWTKGSSTIFSIWPWLGSAKTISSSEKRHLLALRYRLGRMLEGWLTQLWCRCQCMKTSWLKWVAPTQK